MREIFTDRNFIESKILVLAKIIFLFALVIFFLPLFILPFFNHAGTDDYFYGFNFNSKSLIAYQLFIYNNWSGRFSATFAGCLFTYKDYLFDHYYLHTLLLLFLNFSSILFLITAFDRHVSKTGSTFLRRLMLTTIFLALEICSLPQPSTFLFWFSSSLIYHLPVILMQFQIAVFIVYYNTDRGSLRIIHALLLPVLVFIIIGFNELFIIAEAFFFGVIFFFEWHKPIPVVVKFCMLLAFVAGTAIMVLSPGNQVRMSSIDAKPSYVGFVSVMYNCLQASWYVFKNPYIWFVGSAIFLYAETSKQLWLANKHIRVLLQKKWFILAGFLLFLAGAIAIAVTALKGGLLPERYLNAVNCILLLLLVIIFFVAGLVIKLSLFLSTPAKKTLIYTSLIAGILCNTYVTDAYKSLIIAPVYNHIMNERELALKQAAVEKNKTATVKSYDAAIENLLQTRYISASATFKKIVQEKPPLLFFADDLADAYSIDILKNYYQLDNIVVLKK